jgi:hypothetical protein
MAEILLMCVFIAAGIGMIKIIEFILNEVQ